MSPTTLLLLCACFGWQLTAEQHESEGNAWLGAKDAVVLMTDDMVKECDQWKRADLYPRVARAWDSVRRANGASCS